jgi:SAM-dependent methyltransferase
MSDRKSFPSLRFIMQLIGAVTLSILLPGVWSASAQSTDSGKSSSPFVNTSQLFEFSQYLASTSGAPDCHARVVRAAFDGPQGDAIKMTAYEENRSFVYAVARMQSHPGADSGGPSAGKTTGWVRRLIILNPSLFIIEDQLITPNSSGMKIGVQHSTSAPKVSSGTAHIIEPSGEIFSEILFPRKVTYQVKGTTNGQEATCYFMEPGPLEATPGARILQVLRVGKNAPPSGAVQSEITTATGTWKLTATIGGKIFKLTLPPPAEGAGEVAIDTLDGKTLVGNRPFPSGILPHGPEGNRLLELWDADYRGKAPALWDIGRPADELQKVVAAGKVARCRVVDMCCGSGTDAIYLASKGFDVTAIDVAPSALGHAMEKARQANVSVQWMVADILAPPVLKPFDFVYDRGCYHVVRDQNLTAYLETVRRFSRPGTKFLLLATRGDEQSRVELSGEDHSGGGHSGVTEEELRFDFLTMFDVEWLRQITLESSRPGVGPPGWSAFMVRNAAP